MLHPLRTGSSVIRVVREGCLRLLGHGDGASDLGSLKGQLRLLPRDACRPAEQLGSPGCCP